MNIPVTQMINKKPERVRKQMSHPNLFGHRQSAILPPISGVNEGSILRPSRLHARVIGLERALNEISLRVHRNNIRYIKGAGNAYPSTSLIRSKFLSMLMERRNSKPCY